MTLRTILEHNEVDQCLSTFDHIRNIVEFKNDYVLGFIICEKFTAITLQDWVGWGIFTVIPGYPRRVSGDSQHLEARSELQVGSDSNYLP